MAQAHAVRPSRPSFKNPQAPVEVSRVSNSAILELEASNQAKRGSVIVHSGGPTLPDSGRAVFLTSELRVRAAHEAWIWVAEEFDAEVKLRQELSSYAQLEDNWDGEGAKAPSTTAIDDALNFLDQKPFDISLPHPEEGREGDVGVYWDNKKAQVFAEVTFDGDGTYAYFAVHGVPSNIIEKCGKDGMNVAGEWPKDLLRILCKIESV